MQKHYRKVLLTCGAAFICLTGSSCWANDSVEPENTQDAIDRICGVNPVIDYVDKYSSAVMDEEMKKVLIDCIDGDLNAQILSRDIANGGLKGCLIKKYGFQELDPYIEKIGKGYEEARENTKGLMGEYTTCNNSIRRDMRLCGKPICLDKKKVKQK